MRDPEIYEVTGKLAGIAFDHLHEILDKLENSKLSSMKSGFRTTGTANLADVAYLSALDDIKETIRRQMKQGHAATAALLKGDENER